MADETLQTSGSRRNSSGRWVTVAMYAVVGLAWIVLATGLVVGSN